jgi:WD40 repeat protein
MNAKCAATSLKLKLATILTCCTLTACSQKTPSEPAPALASAKPVQQLGSSEFRLPRRDGFERPFCFSPDGMMIAGANWNEVRVWSFPDGKLLHDFTDKIDSRCIALSEGKELLAFEQREMAIYRFSTIDGKLLRKTLLLEPDRPKTQTHYWLSNDGKWLCRTPQFKVWNTSNGRVQPRKDPGPLDVYHARVSRDGIITLWGGLFLECRDNASGARIVQTKIYNKLQHLIGNAEGTLLAGYSPEEGAVVFWDPLKMERVGGKIPVGERDWMPDQAALSADGKRLVFWVSDGEMVFDRKMAVFDVETGKLINSFLTPDSDLIHEPVISPDGEFVFLAGSRVVFAPIEVKTGHTVHNHPDHSFPVEFLSFTHDGATLLVGSREKRQTWDVNTGEIKTTLSRSPRQPFVLAVDNDQALIVGEHNLGLQLVEIATGLVKKEDEGKQVSQLVLTEDRKSVVGIQYDVRGGRSVIRFDPSSGKVIESWKMPGNRHEMATYDRYAFHGLTLHGSRLIRFEDVQPAKKLPDGKFDWGRREMLLEDWTTQQVTNRLKFHSNSPYAVTDAADNNVLAIITSDDWYGAHRTKELGSTYLWITDINSGKERFLVTRDRKDYWSSFSHVALSRDSRLVATVSHKDRIELWNGDSGKLLQQLDAPNDVAVIEFSDDGTKLASGHQDGRVLLWNTKAAHELAQPERLQ